MQQFGLVSEKIKWVNIWRRSPPMRIQNLNFTIFAFFGNRLFQLVFKKKQTNHVSLDGWNKTNETTDMWRTEKKVERVWEEKAKLLAKGKYCGRAKEILDGESSTTVWVYWLFHDESLVTHSTPWTMAWSHINIFVCTGGGTNVPL